MPSPLAHGIAGGSVGAAGGVGLRGTLTLAALGMAPDLDFLVGLALEGEAGAYHRAWWSHSPAVAFVAAPLVALAVVGMRRTRGRPLRPRSALLIGALAGAALLTHPLLDFVLYDPLSAIHFELLRAAGWIGLDGVLDGPPTVVLMWIVEVLFVGGLGAIGYAAGRVVRARLRSQRESTRT